MMKVESAIHPSSFSLHPCFSPRARIQPARQIVGLLSLALAAVNAGNNTAASIGRDPADAR
jgi:hypothetical protein